MAGKTLADNHLSSLASKGRYGDTEMARTSEGELWHVNPVEKALMSMMGKEGEKLVDAIGSGTTNPETGLEEKVADPFSLGLTAATFAYGAYQSGSAAEEQAKMEQRLSQEALQALNQQEQALETGVVSKKKAEVAKYSMGVEDLSAETGIAKEDLNKQTDEVIQKQGGLVKAGADERKSEMWGRVKETFGRGRKNLVASLGGAMGEIEGWYEGKKAGIAADRSSLMATIDFAKQREGSFYLGKGLKHVGKKLFG